MTQSFTGSNDGDVTGPASSTDNAVVRFDGATGKLIQDSSVLVSDADAVTGVTSLDVDNINVNGNSITSTNTNGAITLDPDGNGLINLTSIANIQSIARVGSEVTYQITNSDNTNTGSHVGFKATAGGTSGGDPNMRFVVTGGSQYTMGIDNSDSDSLKISTGATPSAATNIWKMTTAGERTMPLQPAFLARAATQSNVTGDGTQHTITYTGEEIFDQNNDFDGTSTYTSPVDARTRLGILLSLGGLTSSHIVILGRIITSNRTYIPINGDSWSMATASGLLKITSNVLADMDAADTATTTVQVDSGTLVVDVNTNSYFYGNIEC